jgi:alpha-galactosidase
MSQYFYGDYYPLTAYSTARDVWIAWQLDLPEIGEGMIQAFRRENCPQESSRLILKGLEENSKYTLTNLDSSDSYMMTGKELMEIGLNVGIKQQPGSLIILYKPDIRL